MCVAMAQTIGNIIKVCSKNFILVARVRHLPDLIKVVSRRAILSTGLGLSAAVCLSQAGLAQSSQILISPSRHRIRINGTGQAAIGRVQGRLQFAYDELGLQYGAPIYLRVIKDQKRLEVWVEGRRKVYVRLRSYRICGATPVVGPRRNGPIARQPEGFYHIGRGALRPQAVAYLGMDIGWPNSFDAAQGWQGVASFVQAGCAGEPHFGLTDPDMEEVFTLVHSALKYGQPQVPVHIFPFEMNALRMMTARNGPNAAFWAQLVPAWRAFETTKKPPHVQVTGRRYRVVPS